VDGVRLDTPEGLRREIDAGFQAMKPAVTVRKTILDSYKGQAFTPDGMRSPENRAHEFVSIMTGKLVNNDPRANVTHGGGYEQRKTAAVMTAGLNEWIIKTKHGRFLQRMCPYFLTGWGISLTTLEPVPGITDTEDEITIPNVVALEPDDVTCDPYASSWETKRWCCHKYARDKDELVEYAKSDKGKAEGWDAAAIEECSEDAGLEELSVRKDVNGSVPRRGEVILYDVWVRGLDGKSYLYTMGLRPDGMGRFLREVRDYYGPSTGPYTLWGVYSVPGRWLPMSPLMAVWGQIEELNRNAVAVSVAAKRGKSIAVSALSDKYTKALNDARDGDTVHVPAFKREQMEVYEYGYVTKERVELMAMLGDRCDRILGMDDTARGNVTGTGTATEVALANNSSTARVDYIAQRFQECDEALLMTVCWYLYHEDTVTFDIRLDDDEREKMGVDRVTFQGGSPSDPWDGFALEIERYSMSRTSEQVQRARGNDILALLGQVAPIMPQIASYVDVEEAIEQIGSMWNIPGLSRIFSGDKAAEQMSKMQQIQAAPEGAPMPMEDPPEPAMVQA